MSEWLKEHAWKVCMRATVSWVRIPSLPPFIIDSDSRRSKIQRYFRLMLAIYELLPLEYTVRMSVVELENISKTFGLGGATTVAIDDVSLKIAQGEFVAIMGPSGSGKTTLLNVIGLLDNPTQGSYKLLGEDVSELSSRKQAKIRRNQIGFVFQSFNLLPNMSALENVALPLAYSGKRHLKRAKLASDMLERLDIRKKEYYLPRQLSGGQVQRAAIARALINNPSIVVADEPTGNLDSKSSQVIMELLKGINEQGNTILMVTHNPALTRYATRVIYMQDGEIRVDQELGKSQQVDLTKLQDAVLRQDKRYELQKIHKKAQQKKAGKSKAKPKKKSRGRKKK